MSILHPIIAATGSSGAGTSTVSDAFSLIFDRLRMKAALIEGDAFHIYDRVAMQEATQRASIRGENFSHFGSTANHFDRLEELFRGYAKNGSGETRQYLRDVEALEQGKQPGTFSDWNAIPRNTDVLFYEGLHGGVVTSEVDLVKYVDLLVGITPTINLEWTQKIVRDSRERGYTEAAVRKNILRRMSDYVQYILPQFDLTDVNFQRVPMVDTSNPFSMDMIPSQHQSLVVIRFRDPKKLQVDFPHLLAMLRDSFMATPETLVVPGSRMGMAIELIFTPIIEQMLTKRRRKLKAIRSRKQAAKGN